MAQSSSANHQRAIITIIVVLMVIAGLYFYAQERRREADAVFPEPEGFPHINGLVDRWEISGNTATAVVEVSEGNLRKYTLHFNDSTEFRKVEFQKDAEGDAGRVLRRGIAADIHEGVMVEVYAREPLNYFQGYQVATLIYR